MLCCLTKNFFLAMMILFFDASGDRAIYTVYGQESPNTIMRSYNRIKAIAANGRLHTGI